MLQLRHCSPIEHNGQITVLTDEYRYKILKRLEANPEINQRELAQELGISLGKANYCLRALVQKGLLKINNFRNNQNKTAYLYLLTPGGMEEKAKVTLRFMQHKLREYEALKHEIELLQNEAEQKELLEKFDVNKLREEK